MQCVRTIQDVLLLFNIWWIVIQFRIVDNLERIYKLSFLLKLIKIIHPWEKNTLKYELYISEKKKYCKGWINRYVREPLIGECLKCSDIECYKIYNWLGGRGDRWTSEAQNQFLAFLILFFQYLELMSLFLSNWKWKFQIFVCFNIILKFIS